MSEALLTTKQKLQLELEQLYSKNQLIPRIREEFINCKEFNFVGYLGEQDIPEDFGIALLVQMVLHKRASLPVLVGVLQHYCESPQACADLLLKAAVADLMDWNDVLSIFIIRFDIDPEVQAELDRYQFPLPMVIPPKTITKNSQSGYLLNNSSVILKDNHHENDVCLDHLNKMNSISFCIDIPTSKLVKNSWRNLDKMKAGETKADFERRVRAFEKYDRTCHDVMDKLTSEGNEFYLTHRYDKRGRTYCQGYHINYQGTPWNKAVIQLTEQELIP